MYFDYIIHSFILILAGIIFYSKPNSIETTSNIQPYSDDFLFQKLQQLNSEPNSIEHKDLKFLETCLDHPKDHISLMASETLSKSNHKEAFNILFSKIEQIDNDIQTKSENIVSLKQGFYEKFADDLEVPSFYNSKGLKLDLHPKIKENNFAILEPYKSISEQTITDENIRFIILRLLENSDESTINQYAALQSLKAFIKHPPILVIQHFLYSKNNETKQASIELLAYFKLKEFIPRLEVELMGLKPSIVIQAIYALIELKAHSSLNKIRHLKNHRHPLVKNAVLFAIKTL
ncbi:MAG: hypothetical protein COB02_01530 [Candidatus Cloacimonadota bacterium]|nr:MAG: hypothetical protein COB02_01530 [Candidatus Cloacimonadota bacterium]